MKTTSRLVAATAAMLASGCSTETQPSYLGVMSEEDTDEARTNMYFVARRAVQECAGSR